MWQSTTPPQRRLSGQLSRPPGETVSGGPYAITQGTLAADSNYTINFTASTLTITPAPLSVTANPQTKVYGTSDPSLTNSVTGLVDTTMDGVTIDDTAASVLMGHLVRTAGETVAGGPYAIAQGTLAADSNYTLSFTGSTLTITPAPLTVSANPQTKVYGTVDPALTDTATGFVDATVDGVTIDDTAATALTGQLRGHPGRRYPAAPTRSPRARSRPTVTTRSASPAARLSSPRHRSPSPPIPRRRSTARTIRRGPIRQPDFSTAGSTG